MKNKLIAVIILFIICFSFCYAEELIPPQNEIAKAYENKNVTIKYNDNILAFYTANKDRVYPLTYNDSTYLPVRAISSLYYVPILWDGLANSIYLNSVGQIDKGACEKIEEQEKQGLELVDVLINKQIKVIYNNMDKEFYDVNNQRIYPISYNDTTYLPIRAIANLFNCFVDYDFETNTVLLGDKLNSELKTIYDNTFSVDEQGDSTEFTYMLTNYSPLNPISGDIIFRIGNFNDSLCWDINLYEEDSITGKNIYEDIIDEIFDEIEEKASGDELTKMLLIQKYNLDNLYPEYYEKTSGDFYFHLGNLYIVNGSHDGIGKMAKRIKVSVNEDKEYEFELEKNNEPQIFEIEYYQEDISKAVDIHLSVLEAYEDNNTKSDEIYILDITPYLDSNIPQGR